MAPNKGQMSATPSEFQERYQALKKLDPDIALQYAVGVNSGNREVIRTTGTTKFQGGFGRITNDDVDLIIAAATDDDNITEKEEEALLIILATNENWGNGDSKKYMIEQIEKNLKLFWSTSAIDQKKAGQLLMPTSKIDFESEGKVHKGTNLHYRSAEFQTIVHLIGRKKITAWEVSGADFYARIPGAGTGGYYNITPNEIYVVSSLALWEKQAIFSAFVTKAILDFRNGTWDWKFCEADSAIVQGFVALSLKQPNSTSDQTPVLVAMQSGGASDLLMKPVAKRDAKWKAAFKLAYDDVVEAYITRVGDAKANSSFFLETSAIQSDEKKEFFKELKKAMKP